MYPENLQAMYGLFQILSRSVASHLFLVSSKMHMKPLSSYWRQCMLDSATKAERFVGCQFCMLESKLEIGRSKRPTSSNSGSLDDLSFLL